MRSNHDIKKAARQHVIGDAATFQVALSLSIGLIVWQFIFGLLNSNSAQYQDLMQASLAVTSGNSAMAPSFMEKLQNYAPALLAVNLLDGIVSAILALGASWTFVLWRQVKVRPPQPMRQSLRFFKWPHVKDAVVLMAVRYLIVLVGYLCFVLPGIIFSLSFAMAPFLYAADVQTNRPVQSITVYLRASTKLMQGYRMQLLWLNLSFIGWSILSSLTMGLAGLYVIPYYQSSLAEFYLARQHDFESQIH